MIPNYEKQLFIFPTYKNESKIIYPRESNKIFKNSLACSNQNSISSFTFEESDEESDEKESNEKKSNEKEVVVEEIKETSVLRRPRSDSDDIIPQSGLTLMNVHSISHFVPFEENFVSSAVTFGDTIIAASEDGTRIRVFVLQNNKWNQINELRRGASPAQIINMFYRNNTLLVSSSRGTCHRFSNVCVPQNSEWDKVKIPEDKDKAKKFFCFFTNNIYGLCLDDGELYERIEKRYFLSNDVTFQRILLD